MWQHPRLGTCNVSKGGWSRTVHVPAFAAFSYDTGYSNARRSTGDVSLGMHYHLLGATAAPSPPPEMVALAEKVMADPQALVNTVIAALWDDFNGRGPDSGMWWHGGMETINKSFMSAGLPPPAR